MNLDQAIKPSRKTWSSFVRAFWPGACIVVAAVALYSNSLTCPFIFDDEGSIINNTTIRDFGDLESVLFPPHTGVTVEGRPVVNLSLAVNYAIGRLDVWSYHIFNIAIHVLAGLALFGLARRTLSLDSLPDWLRRSAKSVAFAIAIVWLVHPIQTESVTYIVQRAESLMGLFYLATLYFFIRGATGSRWWHAAAIAACGLGMASKEVMASAPVIILFYDRAFLAGSFHSALQRRWPVYAGLAATWAILAALLAGSFNRGGSAGLGMGVAPLDYAMTQCKVVCEYLALCFWPAPLVLDYNTPIIRDWQAAAPYAAVLAVLIAATAWAIFRRPQIGFVALAFFAILAPTSSFIPVKDAQFEHRMYLPLAAVAAMTIVAFQAGFIRLGSAVPKLAGPLRIFAWLGLVAVCLAMGVATLDRNQDYHSLLSIWQATVRDRPGNDRAWYNLARVWQDAGDMDKALAGYNRAIELKPDAMSYSSRGNVLRRMGRMDYAMRDYDSAIAMAPRWADAYYNRANAYLSAGRFEQAVADYTRAIELNGDFFEAYMNRGSLLAERGRLTDALADFSDAIRISPGFAMAYRSRAIVYHRLGRQTDAAADAGKFIQLGGKADSQIQSILGN